MALEYKPSCVRVLPTIMVDTNGKSSKFFSTPQTIKVDNQIRDEPLRHSEAENRGDRET
jgi:hypothetical protein